MAACRPLNKPNFAFEEKLSSLFTFPLFTFFKKNYFIIQIIIYLQYNLNLKLLILFSLSLFSIHFAHGQCDANFNISGNKCYEDTLHFNFTGTGDSLFWDFGDVNSGALNFSKNSKYFN